MFITLVITFSLFLFILFLVYLIYCFAYYNEYQESVYVDAFNQGNYKRVYDSFSNANSFDYESFLIPVQLMYDKNNLKAIYYSYYSQEMSLDDFLTLYYYGDQRIQKENIVFESIGKTDLFHRRQLYYQEIQVMNKNGYRSSLGVKKDIRFLIESKSTLYIDNEEIMCLDMVCTVDSIFGGLHTILYTSNQVQYFGIINVFQDEQEISIATNYSLVKVEEDENDVSLPVQSSYSLQMGEYKLSACYLNSGCPSKKSSYVRLNEDGTVDYYTYITLDQAGDTYRGVYSIQGNFLILNFKSHVYRVFDYDTKEATDIEASVDIEIRFKIEDDYTISNEDYQFRYSI